MIGWSRKGRAASAVWGLFAALLVLLWQASTVYANYGGDWTALFCTGGRFALPPGFEGTYVFPQSNGYDGQWYRYIAHDPLASTPLVAYVDLPEMRYRRILAPGLAAMLSYGRKSADAAYIAVILGFIFAGACWFSRWASLHDRNAAWGMAFLGVPATLIAADRLTTDVALAALAAGAAYYWHTRRMVRLYAVLAAACLSRETGILLAAAWIAALLFRREWRRALLFATAVVPTWVWYVYLSRKLSGKPGPNAVPEWLFSWDAGILGRLLDPIRYELAPSVERFVRAVDCISLLGMSGALILAAMAGWQLLRSRTVEPIAMGAFFHGAIFAAGYSKQFWDTAFGYSRPFSPMIVLLAMKPGSSGPGRWLLLSVLAIDLRILFQLGPQFLGILRFYFRA